MKLPLSWIKEIIDINQPPHQIAKLLTHAGLEVDSLVHLPLGFEKVIVGEVVETEKHPDAEKLCVALVTDGSENYQVVCGAPNCRKGLKTAFAMEGATLTDNEGKSFKVKKTKLRGVESKGMLCSEKELGLGEDHSKILEFADHLKVGTDVAEIYGDIILEISLTPNLGHCANAIGVARELSAATGQSLKLPVIKVEEDLHFPIEKVVGVDVLDKEKCPRYACRVIKNVKIGPSPLWMQQRLIACDLRPVNNIVDITNYVLMEMGHPLHAFDYKLVDDGKIIVRDAKENEKFVTLDEKEHALCKDDLLICDKNKPIAIAGVMGGMNSEVSNDTQDILLESAFFQPRSIRRTSKRLGLQTEASKRFERGCDYNAVLKALDRASELMRDIAGGTICKGVIDIKDAAGIEKVVTCRFSRINQLLGTKLSLSEVETIFHRLEMGYAWNGQDLFTVKPPSYRVDVNAEVDLIEEIARIYGIDNIPKPLARYTSSLLPHAPIYLFENEIRKRLITEGLQEFLTCDLIGPTLLNIVQADPFDGFVKVINPTSVEQSILRTSLLPALLQVVKYNFDHEVHDVSGFEIGKVHFKKDDQYKEQSIMGIVLSGKRRSPHWDAKPQDCDFYDLKGIIENLMQELCVNSFSLKNNNIKRLHPGRQASIYVNTLEIGSFGEIHPSILRRLDFPQKVLFAEIDLHDLIKVSQRGLKFNELPIYPSSTRDLTITLDADVPIQEIFDTIYSISSSLLETVSLSDVYCSDKLGPRKKNVTFHFVYRDKKKTVAQEAVDAEHARIQSQIDARIRR
jgi:phenylalanyl-tRNA synthetase beta chain